ncbi:hypothetical protein EIN_386250 [Entamoeba invadens IP1]|uniref:TLDc domain-containing protein n=1 Tax=Entamoeba invadens IP1 TaxID=370355 RepID=A0A0A1UDW3_ENTIV|nr:hypothetical protein EIN_386250 [Entamoeba invadens IP1]ELP91981.1 hypothetical protein EIN_386250 [Entamoeba invadens IP1]|eukprot:XP_004258752.1 hypothetical protein EIN_386250 [Entamoeba invadens IP1]
MGNQETKSGSLSPQLKTSPITHFTRPKHITRDYESFSSTPSLVEYSEHHLNFSLPPSPSFKERFSVNSVKQDKSERPKRVFVAKTPQEKCFVVNHPGALHKQVSERTLTTSVLSQQNTQRTMPIASLNPNHDSVDRKKEKNGLKSPKAECPFFHLSQLLLDPHESPLNAFKQITRLRVPRVLYYSNKSYSTKDFNSKVCGHNNVMVIVTTADNDVFGCYHEESFPTPKDYSVKVESSEKFFLYGYNNNTENPIYPLKQGITKTVVIHPNDDKNFFFTVFSAFWILSEGVGYIHQNLRKEYNIAPTVLNPFTSKNLLSPIKVESVLVVEWTE